MSSLRCPYCLKITVPYKVWQGNVMVYKCTQCRQQLPRDYVENNWQKGVIGLVGFTGHGKTCYLTSLFYILQNNDIFANWFPIDQNTLRVVHNHINQFSNGTLPKSTPANFPTPALLEFNNTPYFGNFFLSFYDTAGSVFQNPANIFQQGGYVAKSDVVLFIISMHDSNYKPEKMTNLLDTYIVAVNTVLNLRLKKQHLIVVLSKADLFLRSLPPTLEDFLQKGTYKWYFNHYNQNGMKGILNELKDKSRNIREWLNDNGYTRFINIANRFKSVEYTIVSALGNSPNQNNNRPIAQVQPTYPKRVLDPFLLALDKIYRPSILIRIFHWLFGG